MEFYSDIILIIMTGNSFVLNNDGNFPSINLKDKKIVDTAGELFYDITNILPITEHSGWVFLEEKYRRDDVLLMRDGKRLIEFVYTVFLPEQVKLKEGYKWENQISKISEMQRLTMEKALTY